MLSWMRARPLRRLLGSFQNNLEEVTIIAMPQDGSDEEEAAEGAAGSGGRRQAAKAVQLHSFLDPAKGARWPCCSPRCCFHVYRGVLFPVHS
jgi:hypothetical protein